MDHQADFQLLVLDQLGKLASEAIDWSAPRVICIAADFTKFDSHAVQQIGRTMELIRYRRFAEDLLLLESASSGMGPAIRKGSAKRQIAISVELDTVAAGVAGMGTNKLTGPDKTFTEVLAGLSEPMRQLLASEEFSTSEIVMYRGVVGVIVLAIIIKSQGCSFRTTMPLAHLWRCIIGVVSLWLWYYSIAELPLATASGWRGNVAIRATYLLLICCANVS